MSYPHNVIIRILTDCLLQKMNSLTIKGLFSLFKTIHKIWQTIVASTSCTHTKIQGWKKCEISVEYGPKLHQKCDFFYKFSEMFGRKIPKYSSKWSISTQNCNYFPPKATFPGNKIPKLRIFSYACQDQCLDPVIVWEPMLIVIVPGSGIVQEILASN